MMKEKAVTLWNELKGYKTYVFAVAAVIYGIYTHDSQVILVGLGLAGLRHGLSTEVAKALVSKDPVKEVEYVAISAAATQAEAEVEKIN